MSFSELLNKPLKLPEFWTFPVIPSFCNARHSQWRYNRTLDFTPISKWNAIDRLEVFLRRLFSPSSMQRASQNRIAVLVMKLLTWPWVSNNDHIHWLFKAKLPELLLMVNLNNHKINCKPSSLLFSPAACFYLGKTPFSTADSLTKPSKLQVVTTNKA